MNLLKKAEVMMIEKPLTPARRIDASPAHLMQIGLICAIQGQIDTEIILSTAAVLKVRFDEAVSVVNHVNINKKMDVWTKIIEENCTEKELIELSKRVSSLVIECSDQRNALVHGAYAGTVDGGFTVFRTKSMKQAHDAIEEIESTLDKLCIASRIAAHLSWRLMGYKDSPWEGTFPNG